MKLINQLFNYVIKEIIFLIPTWLMVLAIRMYLFTSRGSIEYSNIKDNLIYPAIAVLIIFIFLKIVKNQSIQKIVKNQLLIGYIYLFLFFSNFDLKYLFIFHFVIAIFVLVRDLKIIFNIKEKFVYIILLIFSISFLCIHDTPNGLFSINNRIPTYDNFSEGISYNSSYYYYKNPDAIKKYFFLPVIKYSEEPFHIIQDEPVNAESVKPSDVVVYTHYPAGSDLINYVLINILGPDTSLTLTKYRIFPFIAFLIGFIYFSRFLYQILKNNWLSLLIALIVFLFPAFDRFKLSLYYYSYAFSLLMFMFYITSKYIQKPKNIYLAILGVLGVVQIWFSFDLIPMIFLSIFAIQFLPLKKQRNKYKLLVGPAGIVAIGFIIGFVLRILHNSIYYGNIPDTINDLVGVFAWRSSGLYDGMPLSSFYIQNILANYNFTQIPSIDFFGLQIQMCAFAILGLLILLANLTKKKKYINLIIYMILTIIASYIWIYIMRNHAAIHTFVLTRHFILMLISIFIVVAILIKDLVIVSKLIKETNET